MPGWYDEAHEELDTAFNNGEITEDEYRRYVRDLNDELRSLAEELALDPYNDIMKGY